MVIVATEDIGRDVYSAKWVANDVMSTLRSSPPEGSAMTEPVQCPECGWTGQDDDLVLSDGDRECPVCAGVIEFVE